MVKKKKKSNSTNRYAVKSKSLAYPSPPASLLRYKHQLLVSPRDVCLCVGI